MKELFCIAFCLGFALHLSRAADGSAPAADTPEPAPEPPNEAATNPVVRIDTTLGTIDVELWPAKAPLTVKNFLTYVDDGFFDGLLFHRVIKNFMIQGGGFTRDMRRKATRAPIKNEARKDTPNQRGTLAMARTGEIHSATSQFFINLVDNDALNHTAPTPRGFGYCVFGKVIKGLEVLDKIGSVPTARHGGFGDVPREPVVIRGIRRIDPAPKAHGG